jgi:ribosome-associated protein
MKEFNLDGRAFIELYKILKIEGMASSGGEAKGIVATGQVLVNGVTETQKRKKLLLAISSSSGMKKSAYNSNEHVIQLHDWIDRKTYLGGAL